MIPIRDVNRSETFPLMNYAIIGANLLAFFWQLSLGQRLEQAFFQYGLVPLRYTDHSLAARFTLWEQVLPFFTSMFLHGGVLHLLGNMWSLYLFGDNVEDRLGHVRYLLFYLLCGLTAGITHLITNADSQIPTIGASGAISGVMGAYLLLFPRARILTLLPIFFFLQLAEVPAFLFLGLWFLMQIVSAGASSGQAGGVAWWAHIGGFLAGMVLLKIFQRLPRAPVASGFRDRTRRSRTPRMQPLSGTSREQELDIRGWITLTPREAALGTRKLISVPGGFRGRTVLVSIPPGSRDGMVLRLRGLGGKGPNGRSGDLYLVVRIL